MKNKVCLLLIAISSTFLNFCLTGKNGLSQKNLYEIEIIKFMDLNHYPRSVDEKIFWDFSDEHASFKILTDKNSKSFLDDIKEFDIITSQSFPDYKYAFLIKREQKIDTIYSDSSLKYWKHKVNGNSVNYYDESYSLFLREHYTFFSDCW